MTKNKEANSSTQQNSLESEEKKQYSKDYSESWKGERNENEEDVFEAIEGTPFVITKPKESENWIVGMGKYILFEYESYERALKAIEEKDWMLTGGMISAFIADTVENIKKIENDK